MTLKEMWNNFITEIKSLFHDMKDAVDDPGVRSTETYSDVKTPADDVSASSVEHDECEDLELPDRDQWIRDRAYFLSQSAGAHAWDTNRFWLQAVTDYDNTFASNYVEDEGITPVASVDPVFAYQTQNPPVEDLDDDDDDDGDLYDEVSTSDLLDEVENMFDDDDDDDDTSLCS